MSNLEQIARELAEDIIKNPVKLEGPLTLIGGQKLHSHQKQMVDGIATLILKALRSVAPPDGWQPIETAKESSKAVWVANHEGMEPCHLRFSKWVNCYTGEAIDWVPTHWIATPDLPAAPKPPTTEDK